MCAPALIIGVLAGGLGFVQHQMTVAAQNEAIETQNINADAQFKRDQLQVKANRFGQQQQFDSTQLANETSADLAARALEKEVQSINLLTAQAQEEAAIKKREKKLEVTRAKGEILATGKGGINIFNLLADVDSQYGQFDYAVNRNLAFTGAIADQDKRSANIRRASRLATLNPYIKQTYIDPIRPVDAPKIRSNTGLALLSAGLQGASAGMSWSSGMNQAGYEWKGWGKGGYQKVGRYSKSYIT